MSEPAVADRTSTPAAVSLGPVAIVLGATSATIAWMPQPPMATLLSAVIVGVLAVALGAVGIRHARQGTGRLWTAVTGTTLGAAGLVIAISGMWSLRA
ncbi:hypothetical protein [Streptomyces flavidovirens]|uniref:Integral membrane protein n=1 Tax=Streptomyces flavidovirens TaxID=67298 RepID=A0ABW6R9U9_9ACTN